MPVSYSAVNCTNRHTKGSAVKFFVFPADPELWTVTVSWGKWLPSKHDRLCSAHFVSGRPSNVPDRVDYVPSIFTDGKKRRPAASEESRRSGRASKRLKVCEDREEMKVAAEALLDLPTSSASMPLTNDASTQTGLAYTDIYWLCCGWMQQSESKQSTVEQGCWWFREWITWK